MGTLSAIYTAFKSKILLHFKFLFLITFIFIKN